MPYKDSQGKINHIEFLGNVDRFDGCGGISIDIIRALTNIGVRAKIVGRPGVNPIDLPGEVKLQLTHTFTGATLGFFHTRSEFLRELKTKYKVGFFGWHTNQIPFRTVLGGAGGDFKGMMNSFTEVVVPCEFSRDLFRSSGVTRPIYKLPWCWNGDEWPLMPRPLERPTFQFVSYGTLTETKAPDKIIEAFKLAFPTEKDVRLVLATRANVFGGIVPRANVKGMPKMDDSRITLVNKDMTRADIGKLLLASDCGVWLTRGETWNMPPGQAALTGLPVIMPTHTGMAEWYEKGSFLGLENGPLSESPYGGQWIDPNVEQAADYMRWAYENRKEARQMGLRGAEHLRENFSLEVFQQNLSNYLDYFGDNYAE